MNKKLNEFKALIERHTSTNGLHESDIPELFLFRDSQTQGRVTWVYEPALIIAAQGEKHLYLNGKQFGYSAGQCLALFMPMAVECEMINVNEQNPMLGIGIRLDLHRLAKLLLKMDAIDQTHTSNEITAASGIFSAPLNSKILNAVIRLLTMLDDPLDTQMLGAHLIDEIYFHLLRDGQGGALRVSLRQQGQIQQISRAVDHLHQNLEKNITIEDLASLSNMSSSGFHKKFKEVMHVSPLQYTKLIRLNKAKSLILEGKNVSEAGFMVGYNSPAQFSREFKREFGMAPSSTHNI